jgi:hypothetical protein
MAHQQGRANMARQRFAGLVRRCEAATEHSILQLDQRALSAPAVRLAHVSLAASLQTDAYAFRKLLQSTRSARLP